jgi:adenylate cyclase
VLFADIAGSMGRAERLDPEEWAALMDRFFTACAQAVTAAGGTVDKFTGDGIMVLFGAPLAQEDHARRACRAALDLLSAARGLDLPVRVGIHSGEVVSGSVGDDVWAERTALGHAVGLAQRMESLAEVGAVWVSEPTARLVAADFELAGRGHHEVKGVSGLVEAFAVLRARTRSPAAVVGAAPLVGRATELRALEDALARAGAGQAQLVGLVGEAGVGKSRLCEEFARRCAESGVSVRRTAGLSHATDVPLLPVIRLLRDAFGVTDDDGPAEAREKIEQRVTVLDPDLVDGLPVLFDFLEVPDPQRPARLAPEARTRQLFAVLRRVTQRRSERETLMLLLEDLHWFDPASRAFLDELVPTFPGTRTLVLANFRPEFNAPWMAHSYYRQLRLEPLMPEAIEELVGALAGRDRSLAALPDHIGDRTGGNPFFVEEVVRSLVEDGTLAGERGAYRLTRPLADAGVPGTVHAVLAARIDRLPALAKETLQAASVIGRTFSGVLAERVTGRLGDLDLLCAAEFLQADGEDGYRFWHPLTQEVAYRSLLAPRRRALHYAVAGALIEADPARLDERAALIATHFAAAGQAFDAAVWEDRAARWAQRRDFAEATRRWQAVLGHLGKVEESEESRILELRTRTQLLRAAGWAGLSFEERDAIFTGGLALAPRLADPTEVPLLYGTCGLDLWSRGLVREALALVDEMVVLSERHPRRDILAVTALLAAQGFLHGGSAVESLRFADLIISRSEDDPDLALRILGCGVLARGWHNRAEALMLLGHPDEARRELDRAATAIRQRQEIPFLPWVLAGYARLADLTGSNDVVEERAAEAVQIVEQAGITGLMRVVALETRGVATLLVGRFDEAAADLEAALAEARERQVGLGLEASLLAHLARVRLVGGDDAGARAAGDEAVEVARRRGTPVFEVLALLVRGRIRADADDLRAALDVADETDAVAYQPFCREQLALVDGDPAALADAAAAFEGLGAAGHAQRVRAKHSWI